MTKSTSKALYHVRFTLFTLKTTLFFLIIKYNCNILQIHYIRNCSSSNFEKHILTKKKLKRVFSYCRYLKSLPQTRFRFTSSGCKDIAIRKLEFMSKIKFLCLPLRNVPRLFHIYPCVPALRSQTVEQPQGTLQYL